MSDRRVALIGEREVMWDDVAPSLAEAAGGEVLEEYVLGVLIERELASRRMRIDDFMVQAEKGLLGRTLARSAVAPETEAERLIDEVRTRRGLGDVRFRSLLERNAGLRMLVRSDPSIGGGPSSVSEEDVRTGYAIKYGTRVRARLIVTPSLQQAEEARRRAETVPFGEVASEVSVDASRAVGGLLDPMSLDDPAYPVALREALMRLEPGAMSGPLGVTWNGQGAFAVVRLEERIGTRADAPTIDQARTDLLEEIRLVRERGAMDVLARRLLSESPPSVLDRSLGWSWDAWRSRSGGPR